VVIKPSNESAVKRGDKVRSSVEDDGSLVDNYTWINSATGTVMHHGVEWTIKPCIHGDEDDGKMTNNCVNFTDGLLMVICQVTVGMTTARAVVALYVNLSERTFLSATTTSRSNFTYANRAGYAILEICQFLAAHTLIFRLLSVLGDFNVFGATRCTDGAKFCTEESTEG